MSTPPAVSLQPFERRHLAQTLQWTNDPELARLLDRSRQIATDEHEQWFASLATRQDTKFFAIEDDARHIGNVWLADIDVRHRKAEVRIVIAADAVNRGSGTHGLSLISDYAFNVMKLHRLYAVVLAFNPRGRRAFEKAGFVLEGTLRDDRFDGTQYVDAFLLARINTSPE
jgi:RimJ/RimL family protein N-acetyltransferase